MSDRIGGPSFTRGALFPQFLPTDPVLAAEADAAPSGFGLDCCEESRSLSCGGVRYFVAFGECPACHTDLPGTLLREGWIGPVRRYNPPGYDVELWHGKK